MRSKRRLRHAVWLLVLASTGGGCATGDPRHLDRARPWDGPLHGVEVPRVPVHGHRVKAHVRWPKKRQITGELLASDPTHLWVSSEQGFIAIDHRAISAVELTVYEQGASGAGATVWAILGGASAISHGMGAVVSLPLWAVVGGALATSVAGDAKLAVHQRKLYQLCQFARFPAGMPAPWQRTAKVIGAATRRHPLRLCPRGTLIARPPPDDNIPTPKKATSPASQPASAPASQPSSAPASQPTYEEPGILPR